VPTDSQIMAQTAAAVTIGGKPHRMSPLRLRDKAEYESFVQSYAAAKARASGLEGDALRAAVKSAWGLTFHSDEALKLSNTYHGKGYMLYLGVVRNHPDMTFGDFMEKTTPDELFEMTEAFNRVNYPSKPAPKATAPQTASHFLRRVFTRLWRMFSVSTRTPSTT